MELHKCFVLLFVLCFSRDISSDLFCDSNEISQTKQCKKTAVLIPNDTEISLLSLGENKTLGGIFSQKQFQSEFPEDKQEISVNVSVNASAKGNYNDQEYLDELRIKLLPYAILFDPSRSPTASPDCKKHSALLFDSFNNFDLWALKMHDASATIPSGILNGNVNQFGDFDQCLSVEGPLPNLNGQYCLAYMQLKAPKNSPYIKSIVQLIQAHNAFRTDFDDPGHRVPRFSLIQWALCVPSSCTPKDVENSLKESLQNLTEGTGIEFQARVEPRMCQVKTNINSISVSFKLVSAFFAIVIFWCIFSTFYEYFAVQHEQLSDEWLTAFSLKKNILWLIDTSHSPDDITAAHGIRLVNALMLLIAHKSMAVMFNPYVNRTAMSENLGQSWTVLGRAAALYTDPFLLLSGLLTSYSIIGKLQKGRSVSFTQEYVARFFRLVPPLAALILFCTFILPYLSSGPQWNLVVGYHAELCQKYWWRNLLFIHNYFGFGDMCLTHTHHLGIDTGLFVFAPLLIVFLWRWPALGVLTLSGIAVIATWGRFYATIIYELSNYIYFGASTKQLFRTADYMYSIPPYRATVYIMGVLLGYYLRKLKTPKLSSNQLKCGWIVATFCMVMSLVAPAPMGNIDYKYNPIHTGLYAALAPITWCAYFCWVMFTSHYGYPSLISNFFSWKFFQITTKLSYSIYLTQFPIYFFNVGRRRNPEYYSFIPVMANFAEYFCIIVASIILTLLFDKPFQNIKNIIFKRNQSSVTNEKVKFVSSAAYCSEEEDQNTIRKDKMT